MLRRIVNAHEAMTLFPTPRWLALAFLPGIAETACGATGGKLPILQTNDAALLAPTSPPRAQGAAK